MLATTDHAMTTPHIAQKAPYALELAAGEYWWCACGKSAKQPFCDGSHKGTGITPVSFRLDEAKKVWMCGCKATGSQPFCDGTHKTL